MVKLLRVIIQNGLVLKELLEIMKNTLVLFLNQEEYNKKQLIKNIHQILITLKTKRIGKNHFQLYSNIVLMFLTTVSLKKIMNIGLLHSIMIKMKLYIEKILISMKLTDTLMILTDIVKFGENLTQHKNQHIGLFGHTQHLKDGVIE